MCTVYLKSYCIKLIYTIYTVYSITFTKKLCTLQFKPLYYFKKIIKIVTIKRIKKIMLFLATKIMLK